MLFILYKLSFDLTNAGILFGHFIYLDIYLATTQLLLTCDLLRNISMLFNYIMIIHPLYFMLIVI